MKSALPSLIFLSALLLIKSATRIPLTSPNNPVLKSSSFLSTYQADTLGLYRNNPFVLEFTNDDSSYYLGISLYSSDILLSSQCYAFPSSFSCQMSMICVEGSVSTQYATSVYFTAGSYTPLSFSYPFELGSAWNSTTSSHKLVSSCTGQPFLNSGFSLLGMVGFGLGSNANQAKNFGNVSSFTITLNSTESGEMVFGTDSNLTKGNAVSYAANSDWIGSWYQLSFGTQYIYQVSEQNFMFVDLSTPFIIVPSSFYQQVVEGLYSLGLVCNNTSPIMVNTGANCSANSTLSLSSLPDLIIQFSPGAFVSLKPSEYVSSGADDNYYLLIIPSSTILNNPGYSYVTPNYLNSVIMGMPVLLKYNVVFDFSNIAEPTVNFYSKNPTIDSPTGLSILTIIALIIGGLLVVVMISLLLCFFFCREKASSYRALRFMSTKTNNNYKTIETPEQNCNAFVANKQAREGYLQPEVMLAQVGGNSNSSRMHPYP